ncbi:MAG: T9SS type B sorting domain-containing protein [Flavobacteriaceae bacterium]
MKRISFILTLIFCCCQNFVFPQNSSNQNCSNPVNRIVSGINSDCEKDFLLSNVEMNNLYTYHASQSILANNYYSTSASNDEIRMKAGKVIVLRPNVHIKKGSLYLARIEPCLNCKPHISFSNFFTPNNDGYNDFWDIKWTNPLEFSEVPIFDRYGKLLKTLTSPTDSWDGKTDTNNVFSSDYWFKINYIDCYGQKKEYQSHFTLKR